MTWSFRLQNGDLSTAGAQIAKTTGSEKLVQDFRCALLEQMGHDTLNPSWGSLIDGGQVNGREVASLIGADESSLVATAIDVEIRRIAGVLQQRQIDRIKSERLTYNNVTLTASEILLGVQSIAYQQDQDVLSVGVTLQTGDNQSIDVVIPLTS